MIFLRSLKILFINLFLSSAMLMSVSYANIEYKVTLADNLSGIVDRFYKDSKLSRYQIYIGLLAENPHAFRFGNINYLKSEQVLNIPESDSLFAMEKKDADNLVAEHNNYVKKGKKIQLDPPFEDYSPKDANTTNNKTEDLANKQQVTSQELQKLKLEAEELRIRLGKLLADKAAMDAELSELDTILSTK